MDEVRTGLPESDSAVMRRRRAVDLPANMGPMMTWTSPERRLEEDARPCRGGIICEWRRVVGKWLDLGFGNGGVEFFDSQFIVDCESWKLCDWKWKKSKYFWKRSNVFGREIWIEIEEEKCTSYYSEPPWIWMWCLLVTQYSSRFGFFIFTVLNYLLFLRRY